MEENKVKKGFGIILEKSEEAKADKTLYWRFKIGLSSIDGTRTSDEGRSFSLWEYPAGNDVRKGDKVELFWTEKEYTNQYGKPGVYRNINSIACVKPSEEIVKGEVHTQGIPLKDVPTVADYVNREAEKEQKRDDKILWGQTLNISAQFALAHKDEDEKCNMDYWFNRIWEFGKKKRKEILE